MKLVSLENITKYNELLNQKMVKSVNSVKPDVTGNVSLGTEKSTFNKVTFDTDYFSVATDLTYSFDLTGTDLELIDKEKIQVRIVAKVTTANSNFEEGDIAELAPGVDHSVSDDLDVCAYIRGNLLYVYSGSSQYLSIRNSTGWLRKDYAQIKVILTAFVPDDGTIQLIATDSTGTTELVGTPSGTLTWNSQNIVCSVNGVNADASGNVTISGGLEIGDIALAPLGIDETDNCRRYLNGQVILQSQFSKFTEKLKHAITLYPNLATTEQNWQSAVTLSPLGQCGKFVINDEAGTIRLPKVVNVMGALDLSSIGELQSAGLPNITGKLNDCFISGGGIMEIGDHALYTYGSRTNMTDGGISYIGRCIAIDASRSSSIYGNSDTVQQEAIKYPYFIQVATSNSENVQIDTQVRLNNPFSLFMPYWSPIELNNLSWLRSNKQWNNGAVYVSAYEFLVQKYNSGTEQTETIAGVSVTYKLADNGMKIITDKSKYDELISASGSAFFFVLDTENTQFILPYTNGFMQFGNELGKFTEAGLPNITGRLQGEVTLSGGGQNSAIEYITTGAFYSDTNYEPTVARFTTASIGGKHGGACIDALRSSPIYGKSPTVQPNSVTGYLYFYVGEVEQDANIIATSGLAESISRKLDIEGASRVGMPSDRYIDLSPSVTEFTAIDDGYIRVEGFPKSSSYAYIYASTSDKYEIKNTSNSSEEGILLTFPVRKGTQVRIYSTQANVTTIIFIYAEGAK